MSVKGLKVGQVSYDLTKIGRKDAFHVPGILVRCNSTIDPGSNVKFTDETMKEVESCVASKRHAIVDPFIDVAQPGTLFWVFIDPKYVENLVHEFEVTVNPDDFKKEEEEDYDDGCRGCYGEEDPDDGCRGCYE